MKASFNLISEGWIPCFFHNGEKKELGIKETFLQARNIKEILDQSPPVTYSIHRLLLAIMHRAFDGPKNVDEWAVLWDNANGDFNKPQLIDYLDKWKDRFDLFDEKYPFYQSSENFSSKKKSINNLAFDISSGNNALIFDHTYDEKNIKIPSNKAIRLLLARQNYSPTSGRGEKGALHTKDSPLTATAAIIINGENLFETLMLNFHQYNIDDEIPFTGKKDKDLPTWEKNGPIKPGEYNLNGYIDFLTLQNRLIKLIDDSENPKFVSNLYLAQGLFIKKITKDPFICYLVSKKAAYYPLSFREEKSLWRDSLSIFQTFDNKSKRPMICDWIADLAKYKRVLWDKTYNISVMGICSDTAQHAKIYFWRHEKFPFPLILLKDENLIKLLKDSTELAEKVYSNCLRGGLYEYARIISFPEKVNEKLSKNDEKTIIKLINSFIHDRIYWEALELPFKKLITEITTTEKDNAIKKWRNTLRKSALKAFQKATAVLHPSARNLKAIVQGDIRLRAGLKKLFGDDEQSDDEINNDKINDKKEVEK